MPDSTPQTTDSSTPKVGAPKDKNCPYCGQAFTSSSLGRHLDLYIKEKNPKPPDGIHDVDAIRKLRGGITRRQPRGSLGGRRDASTPVGTPKGAVKKDTPIPESDGFRSPAIAKENQLVVDTTMKYSGPFQPTWEATGVMNDIPKRGSWEGDATPEPMKRPGMQRTVSKQAIQKAQFDVKQKLSDAMDTARAAELALRELLSSWRAAKVQLDNNSMPFDFDPLSLDFPALTLQCLQPPPTLFSSTQHPTSTSWSVQSPGQREFDALQAFFKEEFRAWKVTCTSSTTAVMEEFTYPPSAGNFRDVREAVRKAEKTAEQLEAQVDEHLQSAYTVWESLPVQRQQELWVLELARGVGRKHKEAEKMKEQHHRLKQENANLKSQIEQLNKLQQPREFKLATPVTVPLERELIAAAYEQAVNGGKALGFAMEDSQVDLSSVVSRSIERWKSVIASSRASSTGMGAQRSLDQATPTPAPPTVNGTQHPTPQVQTPAPPQIQTPQQMQPQQPQQPSQQQTQQSQQQRPQLAKRLSTTSINGAPSEQASRTTSTTGPPSIEETSDQDADAEMEDDDSFAIMNTSPVKPQPPIQQQATLEVPRTRGPVQQRGAQDPRFMMPNGTGSPVGRTAINMSRSMPNMNMAMQNGAMHGADMAMAMQGVRGDPMYLE
ncbi:hypothetical protein NCS57_00398700 [Fusarium keratoplasticum]|uniref:Uncharacterized protein n=1 Tax=Fusarium keratoplasticum TaxID=1328300 RepID=A0ACC0R5G1_9HYPO|nr:hypothetical protein NCS57_00398700 [Fusarium keratoplasticum]KAI8674992.1 hypothetical protein NCS57_00398700 [Fusarium keratoplasticum]